MANFKSKLQSVGTSIFTEMSMLANQHQAINLSQGFPEFDTPDFLKQETQSAIEKGINQYAPSIGLEALLTSIQSLVSKFYGAKLNLDNITVTSGATEALFVAIQTLVSAGDEVIVFDPAYDSYEPSVNLAGGKCVHIPLEAPTYQIDWEKVKRAVNVKTKAIIINTPHNPTGTILSASDLNELTNIVTQNNLYLISDEVYEFITFDGNRHESVLRYPELFERSFVVSSFGKTFHCTGWKLGYCVAPKLLSAEFRKIDQYVTFSSFTPAQIGIASMLNNQINHVSELSGFYQEKRDRLVKALEGSKFKTLPSKGTYFVLADYSEISELDDRDFCHWLTKEKGVALIPLSPFYETDPKQNIVRFCFAKNDQTLIEAANILTLL